MPIIFSGHELAPARLFDFYGGILWSQGKVVEWASQSKLRLEIIVPLLRVYVVLWALDELPPGKEKLLVCSKL